MKEKLKLLYPGIIIQSQPIFEQEYKCFLDKKTNEYIAIPKKLLTEKEILLLEAFFSPVKQTAKYLNNSLEQKKWHTFLFENGSLPDINERIRFIHFHFNSEVNYQSIYDSFYSFFQKDISLIWVDNQTGVVLELETDFVLQKEDFLSFQDAVLTDYYVDLSLYIGRFYEPNNELKNHFSREQYYFHTIRTVIPQNRFYSFNSAFPVVLLKTEWERMIEIIAAEFNDIFRNDKDLVHLIKTFLENNSNTSLAAKKLYMHRNSLQYKIDKFINRTSIDIKNFNGAIAIYFICVYAEMIKQNNS